MKIGFFEIENWEKEPIKKTFPKDQLIFSNRKINANNADKYKDLEVISIFIYSQIDEKLLQKMPKLKLIATRSTGYDHIDVKACAKKNILVCNVPTYGENTVAEQTFALILSLSRKMPQCLERTRKGSFDLTGLRGFDLRGKTLGVVGTGNIGKHVIRIANGFEMKVIAFDAFPNQQFAKDLGFEYFSLDNLLKESDIITLHLPYLPQTHHLIDKNKIALMKKGAILINTSRGGIVETDALVKALESKKLGGAGLDVLEGECNILEESQLAKKSFSGNCDVKTLLENHILMDMPNVVITPHNAFNTNEALLRILNITVDNIKNALAKKPINLIK